MCPRSRMFVHFRLDRTTLSQETASFANAQVAHRTLPSTRVLTTSPRTMMLRKLLAFRRAVE